MAQTGADMGAIDAELAGIAWGLDLLLYRAKAAAEAFPPSTEESAIRLQVLLEGLERCKAMCEPGK